MIINRDGPDSTFGQISDSDSGIGQESESESEEFRFLILGIEKNPDS